MKGLVVLFVLAGCVQSLPPAPHVLSPEAPSCPNPSAAYALADLLDENAKPACDAGGTEGATQ